MKKWWRQLGRRPAKGPVRPVVSLTLPGRREQSLADFGRPATPGITQAVAEPSVPSHRLDDSTDSEPNPPLQTLPSRPSFY